MQVVKLVSLFSFLLLMLMFQPAPAGLAKPKLWTQTGSTEHIGCDSTCFNNGSISNYWLHNSACYGKEYCCQDMDLPPALQVFNSSFESKEGKQGSDLLLTSADCMYSGARRQNNNRWTHNKDTMDCSAMRINSTCSCSKSYEGNPYLQCRDINECEDGKPCHGLTRCVNTKASYKCELHPFWISVLVIGLALGVLFLLIGAWWIHNCIRLKKKFFKRNGGLLLQQQLSSSDGSVQKTKIFSSNELKRATDYFNESRILGHGGQGTVFKGMLADGSMVAVKKSKIVDEDKLEEFINEVVILSQINHRNVVRLLGCCLETEVPLLAYEFIPNGTLSKYLHEQNEDFALSWDSRLRIASEAAGAICHLHSTASMPIYHRDIKSTNILLDEKYRAKVSDFGTSRSVSIDQTHLTTKVQGTFGYIDPEYFRTGQFTDKSDVYSFGVVLVELLSGHKPIFLTRSLETMSLAKHFIDLMDGGRLFDIIDAQVKGDCTEEEAIVIANLAKRCLDLNGRNRPTMREVAMELEGILLSRNGINIQQIGEVDNSSRSISCSSFEIGIDLPLDCKPSTSSETW